ncbi:MAG: hypothetical protein CMG98_05990 [Marinovum sp.]|nr:hypothetical protein [Marinovum sp.]MBF22028.1 hypothetical protein [Marinovum sp.]HCC98717.1 hypothetical protein [Paracoccaceae bacterium]
MNQRSRRNAPRTVDGRLISWRLSRLTVARTDPRVYDFPAWLRFQCAVKTGSEGALGILKLENGLLNLALAHLVFKKGTV